MGNEIDVKTIWGWHVEFELVQHHCQDESDDFVVGRDINPSLAAAAADELQNHPCTGGQRHRPASAVTAFEHHMNGTSISRIQAHLANRSSVLPRKVGCTSRSTLTEIFVKIGFAQPDPIIEVVFVEGSYRIGRIVQRQSWSVPRGCMWTMTVADRPDPAVEDYVFQVWRGFAVHEPCGLAYDSITFFVIGVVEINCSERELVCKLDGGRPRHVRFRDQFQVMQWDHLPMKRMNDCPRR